VASSANQLEIAPTPGNGAALWTTIPELLALLQRRLLIAASPLADAMIRGLTDIEVGKSLLLHEEHRRRLSLSKHGDQDIVPTHLVLPSGLHVDDGAMDGPLEPGRWLCVCGAGDDERTEVLVEVGYDAMAKTPNISLARPHRRSGVAIINQSHQQMLKRREFVTPIICQLQCLMKGSFKALRKRWHRRSPRSCNCVRTQEMVIVSSRKVRWPPPAHRLAGLRILRNRRTAGLHHGRFGSTASV
jgi:hypothetical protein